MSPAWACENVHLAASRYLQQQASLAIDASKTTSTQEKI